MKSKYYKQNKEIVDKYKTKCCICGEDTKCCLEFHHLGIKHFSISNSLNKVTPEQLINELENYTICICKNCHSKLHNKLIKYENKRSNQ